MPTINFIIRSKKNTGLIMNDRELKSLYFYGVDISNQQGTVMSSTTINTQVRGAQEEIEKFLGIKLIKQVIEERSDYHRKEFQGVGIVRTKFTVNIGLLLEGFFGGFKQLSYPKQWLTSNTVNNIGISRQILVVPNSNVAVNAVNDAIFAGSTIPHLGLVNSGSIGSYWKVKYVTGWGCDNLPYDLMEIIGKWAAIKLFNILGDLILGAGIASQSISLDGLSQSIASTASATSGGYGARIIQYMKEIDESLKRLKGVYKGLTLTSI